MQNRESGVPLFVIILAFIFCWPVGLFLLIHKLSHGGGTGKETGGREAGMYAGAPGTRRENAAPKKKKERGYKWMTTLGAIFLSIGIIGGLGQLEEVLWWAGYSQFWEELFGFFTIAGGFGGSGIVLLGHAAKLRRREARWKRYQAYIGSSKLVSLQELSAATGVSYQKLVKDLEALLDQGALPGAYLDYSTEELVLSADARVKKEAPLKPTPQKETPARSEHEKIIDEIVALNKDIEDEEVSRKIDRIEYVTRRIFQCVEEHPEKKPQLDKFMNYYLPNTLKMLRAYAQFEEQKVNGHNIAAAMKDIEDIMDKLVAGFEKQLDRLFEEDAVDISTDITVLEGMLAKDGFTGEEDFKLQ